MRLRRDTPNLLDQLRVFDLEPDSVPRFQRIYAQIHAMGTTARALLEKHSARPVGVLMRE